MSHAGSAISLGRRFLHRARGKLLGQASNLALYCCSFAIIICPRGLRGYMLEMFAVPKMMFHRGMHAAIRKKEGLRCWTHSSSSCGKNYAPPVVTAHVDMIRRHAESFPDEFRPDNDFDQQMDHADVQSALITFESVTGVKREDACEMLQYAPNESFLEGWIDRLLTWKDIHRGKDLFLPGLGSFNVTECFQEQAFAKRKTLALDFFELFRAKFLRKQWTKLQQIPASTLLNEELQEALASCPDLDLADMLQASTNTRKKIFPLNEDRVWRAIFSGCAWNDSIEWSDTPDEIVDVDGNPFWLPTVGDLRTRAYFAEAIASGEEFEDGLLAHYLQELLSRPTTSLQRQHLVRYHDYWNNPDSIRHAMAEDLFDHDGWDKLGGNLPPPKQLWKELGLVAGCFSHLENLPDHGRLHVLRNKFQIINAGKKLHNCLRHDSCYVERVEQKDILLVCMNDDNGKPIAVGEYPLRTRWTQMEEISCESPSENTKSAFSEYERSFAVGQYNLPRWTDIKGKSNNLPTKNTKKAFNEYERSIIQPWMLNNPSALAAASDDDSDDDIDGRFVVDLYPDTDNDNDEC